MQREGLQPGTEATLCMALSDLRRVLSVSDSIQDLLGFKAQDFLCGQAVVQNLIHPDDADIAELLFSETDGPACGTVNIRLRSALGRIRCVKGQYTKEIQQGQTVLTLMLQDARSLKRTMPDASMMVNFKAMMENTDDYIYFKDRNHVFTGASQTLVSLCDPAEHWTDLLGQTDYDVFPEEYADIYYRLEKQVFAGISVAHEEQQTLTKNGVQGWVDNRKYPIKDDQGEIIGLYGIARDITEQKLAQESLQKSENSLLEAQSIARLGSYVLHTSTGIWESSAALEHLMGIAPAGKHELSEWQDLLHPEDRDMVSAYLLTEVIARGNTFDKVYRIIRKNDQAERWVHGLGKLVHDMQGNPIELHGTIQDITEGKLVEKALQLVASVFTYAQEGIVITDQKCAIISVNDAFTRITGYSKDDVLGKNPRLLRAPGKQGKDFYAAMWAELLEKGHWRGEICNRRKNGGEYVEQLTISTIRDEQGAVVQYVGLFSDISERKHLEEKVRKLAFYDVLTQLPNRRLITDRLEQTMASSQRNGVCAAMMFLDLDNFKTLNDQHGHGAGDLLLMEVARRLTECVREMDTVGRVGGDEFVVILSVLSSDRTESETQAQRVAEKIRIRLGEPYALQINQANHEVVGVEHHCTATIGVALFSGHEASQSEIMKWADDAMYRAKAHQRNSVEFHDSVLTGG